MRNEKRLLWQRATVELPASKRGLKLMSQAGYWVNKDGSISIKRDRKLASARSLSEAHQPTLKLAT